MRLRLLNRTFLDTNAAAFHNPFWIRVLTDHKNIVLDLLKTIALIEFLRARILGVNTNK